MHGDQPDATKSNVSGQRFMIKYMSISLQGEELSKGIPPTDENKYNNLHATCSGVFLVY